MKSVEGVFINLDRDSARRAALESQLAAIQLPYPVARLAGIDGARQAARPEGLRPGQYGCWLSHLAALERSLESDRHLHVIEDDARLSRKLAVLPEMLGALAADAAMEWDILYLDATLVEIADMYRMFEWVQQSRAKDIVQVCKVPAQFTVYGTHSYVVNGARKRRLRDFLRSRLNSGYAIDNVLALGIQQGALKACMSAPFLTSGDDAGLLSSVGYEGDHGFLAWLLFRRLCFVELGEDAASLAARAAELTSGLPHQEAAFGALCAYRVAAWPPDSRFTPERPSETEQAAITVSAVIPCLNEERTIGSCVEKARAGIAALGLPGEVIVVDNGSSDRSAEIARSLGARIVAQPVKGYGAALQAGIEASRGRIVVMGDADDSYDWTAIAPFVRKIEEGYDLVLGNRFLGGIAPGAMPALHRYLGNPILSAITRLAFRVDVGDVHCGMRAFTKSAFDRMRTGTSGMEFATEMVANAARNGLRIAEVPTRLYPDKRDRAPHLRSFRDGWRHLRFILTYAPDYLYLAPGAALLLAGLALQVLLASGPVEMAGQYFGIHYLALGAMLSLVGFNVINLGVLAKALLVERYTSLKSRTLDLLSRRFSLEGGLIAGALLIVAGLIIDGAILAIRFAHPGEAMEDTVHLAFVATTMVVLGLNLLFTSFLLAMVVTSRNRAG